MIQRNKRKKKEENGQTILFLTNVKMFIFVLKRILTARSASHSDANRTMPISAPLISANFTSPASWNLSRNICHVVFGGSCNTKIIIKY